MIKTAFKTSTNIHEIVIAKKVPVGRECRVHDDPYLLLNGDKAVTVQLSEKDVQYKMYITDKRKLGRCTFLWDTEALRIFGS